MKICIPILENKFLASEVSGHFGKAPMYLLVESDSGDVEGLIERGNRGHGECAPVEAMLSRGVDAVACKGLGQGASARLAAGGIRIFHTNDETVEAVLASFARQELGEMTPAQLCEGHHGHHHEHGHDHAGCGHG
jgi:predicted Fe-Mo cluster-binding NifX family protein